MRPGGSLKLRIFVLRVVNRSPSPCVLLFRRSRCEPRRYLLAAVASEPVRREHLSVGSAGESDPGDGVFLSDHGVLENKLADRDLDAISWCKRELLVGHEAGTRHEEGAGREGEFPAEVFG